MASKDGDIFDPNMGFEEDESSFEALHKYERTLSILEALGLEEFQEQMEYKTWCKRSSSWDINIKLEKDIPFNNFNMFVSLRRIDFSDYAVEGILVIWFLNIEGKKCPVSYRLECRVDGHGSAHEVYAVDEHYRCLLREEDYLTFPDDVLIVKVQLFVKECCIHTKKDEHPTKKHPEEEKESEVLCCPKL